MTFVLQNWNTLELVRTAEFFILWYFFTNIKKDRVRGVRGKKAKNGVLKLQKPSCPFVTGLSTNVRATNTNDSDLKEH